MKTAQAKILDEECNHLNDAYSDEILYAKWAETARVQEALEKITRFFHLPANPNEAVFIP